MQTTALPEFEVLAALGVDVVPDIPTLLLDAVLAQKSLDEIFADTGVWEEIRQIMVGVVEPIFLDAFMAGAELASRERPSFSRDFEADDVLFTLGFRGLPFDAARARRVGQPMVSNYTDTWWSQFSRATQNGLRRAIQRSADEGTGVRGVIAGITPLFGAQRAKLIAVSETTNLMGMGATETYREAGYTEWEWRTVRDGRVDEVCQSLDRKVFPISVQFQRAHPGCRCWPVPAGTPAGFGDLNTSTANLHADARTGRWSADRRVLHDQIMRDLKQGATPLPEGEQPAFHMMGGGPASGKSTVSKNVDLGFPANRLNVDPDDIKGMLPEYQRMLAEGDARASVFVHEESKYLQQRLVHEGINERYNIFMDGTGDNGYQQLTREVAAYRSSGAATIDVNYMSLDTDLAVKIAKIRERATGRGVPESVIREKHASISEMLPRVIEEGHFDTLKLWDTNIENVPRLIATYDDGVFKIHDDALWQRFLSKANAGEGYEATGRTVVGEVVGKLDEANTIALALDDS